MKIEIKIPPMGESISEAVVGKLLKPSGTQVAAEDEILELETDKVNQVLYAPTAGVIHWTVKPEEVVKIGQVIGFVDMSARGEPAAPSLLKEEALESVPSSVGARQTKANYISTLNAPKQPEVPSTPSQVIQTPLARPSQPSSSRNERRMKLSRIRQVIAKRLVEAQHQAAMLTTFNEIDLSQVMDVRAKHKESFSKEHEGTRLGLMSFFVKAAVSALQAFPEINAFLENDDLIYHDYCDIGVAVGTDKGVVVPVLRSCEALSFAAIEQQIEGYAKKACEGKLTADTLQGGTFTITNGGVYGSLFSTPILNPPQSAILGLHKIEKRPVVINDTIVIRPMMYVALSYDHRVVDGKEAVSFLAHIKKLLEDLSILLLNS